MEGLAAVFVRWAGFRVCVCVQDLGYGLASARKAFVCGVEATVLGELGGTG